MKYDLIIDGVTIPDQVYRDGNVTAAAGQVLEEILEQGHHIPVTYRHVGAHGTHAVAVHWNQVKVAEVRIIPEDSGPE